MRILQVHNRYRSRGGEDTVVEQEGALLRAAGHEVALHEAFNEEPAGIAGKIGASARLMVNRHERKRLKGAIDAFHPQMVHFHNTFMAMGPSVLSIPNKMGVPSCLTAHNYRLFCIAGTAFRDNKICTLCCGRSAFPGARFACYKGNRLQSIALATASQFHSVRRTIDAVDLVIYLNPTQQELLEQHGIRREALHLKPNFVHEPPTIPKVDGRTHLLFLGLLSPEKGIPELLWARQPDHLPLEIVGTGPLLDNITTDAPSVKIHGFLGAAALEEVWRRTRFLVFPSIWLEGMPMVVLEALSRGIPVIANEVNAGAGLARDSGGITYGNGRTLRDALDDASAVDDNAYRKLSEQARLAYESRFSTEIALSELMRAYAKAIENHGRRP